MLRCLIPLFCVLFFSTPLAAGDVPIALIQGPDQVEAGDAVWLKTEGSKGVQFQWLVLPEEAATHFVGLPIYGGLDADGKPIVHYWAFFASRAPGRVTFVLVVAAGDQAAIAVHKLDNGTGPDPDPDPNPDPPRELYGVIVYESGDMIQQRDSAQVNFGRVLLSRELRQPFVAGRLRLVDKDALDEDGKIPPEYKAYLEASRDKILPHLFLMNEKGQVLLDAPLPSSLPEAVELINKYVPES